MFYLVICLLFIKNIYSFPIKNVKTGIEPKLPYKNQANQINNQNLPDYTIPKWVYKEVFKHNRYTKTIKEKDYLHLFRANPKM